MIEPPPPTPPVPPDRAETAPAPRRPWRSLSELAESPDLREALERELPRQAAIWPREMSRRRFLQLAGAAIGLAGLVACGIPPRQQIVPYVHKPEAVVPGKSLYFATAMTLGGSALGLLVRSREGRPVKIEGNPTHPASLGATDALAQGSILELYDPDRSQGVRFQGEARGWDDFWQALATHFQATGGAGLRLLTETVTSPTLAAQLAAVLKAFPQAVWHQYQPVNRDSARAGALLAFGQDTEAVYHLAGADIILSLGADSLFSGPGAVRYAHDFAQRRRPENGPLNRFYAVDSNLTSTSAMADHRLPLRDGDLPSFAAGLAAALGAGPQANLPAAVPPGWLAGLVRDLQAHRGASVVIPGQGQPAEVHALAHLLNDALGAVGKTVTYLDPIATKPVDETASLQALVQAMTAGQVQTLLILGGNPAYNAPADLAFGEQMARVGLCAHLSLYEDETSALCQWHLPESHYLEAWGDARAYDGTASIVQPLISPLYSTLSASELLARLAAGSPVGQPAGYDLVRAVWQPQASGSFDAYWKSALNDGVLPNTTAAPVSRALVAGLANKLAVTTPAAAGDIELVFRPDPAVFDGRFANNPWLQEWPRPVTQLTWDNAALMAPVTAAQLGLQNDQLVELSWQGRSLTVPVFIVPGHAADSITLHLGYGRSRAGQVGTGVGFNAYQLRTTSAPWRLSGVQVRALSQEHDLVLTRDHHLIEGRDLVRVATLAEYQANENFAHSSGQPPLTLYPTGDYPGERWGMVIDLNACVGCNACVLACQAENNIPVVGKEQVANGREMHWLRVDSYFFGEPDNPEVHFQPVPCMQCERAPCEPVCPVGATVHSSDGLNDMVYNRCVGTRFCSNNCPYKVRRFNFLQYEDASDAGPRAMQRNPDVTVRTRGVMEKCTYCVQRIRTAQITAQEQGRAVQDGEVVTACQGVCPAQAITFGDLRQTGSAVAKQQALPRDYALLEELGTRPRTTYLAAVRNPNPEIV